MSIADIREKCKSYVSWVPRDVLILSVLLTTALLSFGLGYLAGEDTAAGARDARLTMAPVASATSDASVSAGQVVASKNGTKYYPLDCAGANRISEANKIWFPSGTAAVQAGYAPAANCK